GLQERRRTDDQSLLREAAAAPRPDEHSSGQTPGRRAASVHGKIPGAVSRRVEWRAVTDRSCRNHSAAIAAIVDTERRIVLILGIGSMALGSYDTPLSRIPFRELRVSGNVNFDPGDVCPRGQGQRLLKDFTAADDEGLAVSGGKFDCFLEAMGNEYIRGRPI